VSTTPTRSVVIEREMPHPAEKIWRALTQGHLIKAWLMDNDFRPAVGHEFTFRSTPVPHWDGIIEGKVLVVDEPNKRLSYTWGSLGLESVVTWTLTPTETGTLVRMEHAGFRVDQVAAYNGAKYGWKNFMSGLEKVAAELE
jgi:uncharacterized protein YndB with AHSA1/START domain